MKKVTRTVLLLILSLMIVFSSIPLAGAASTTQQNKSTVYRFLTNTLKLNRAAASGIMANIEKESKFNPTSVHIDSNGRPSGGLCQWNGSRFDRLKKFCSSKGYNYLSVTGQMNYLKSELGGGYNKIYKYMKSVSNSAAGAYNAGYYWCYNFEIPSNRKTSSVTRGNLAKSYFNNFQPTGSELKAVTVKTNASGGNVSFLSNLKVSWTSAGTDCTGYIVELAPYKSGAYKWNEATGAYTTSLSYTFSAYELGIGTYGVRVTAVAAETQKKSSVVKVVINCGDHLYSSKVTKKATATADGTIKFTCQHCGKSVSKKISAGTLKSNATLAAPKVSASRGGLATTLKFSGSKGATGYIIYIYSGGTWVKLATMPGSSTSCKLPEVYKGAKLAVVAFRTLGAKTVNSNSATCVVK